MGTVSNVKVEPMNVTWGTDTAQVSTIACAADVGDSLDGKYFFIYTASNSTKYHVWFNTSGGGAVDPAPGGSTAVAVAITTGDTASAVATAVASALDALAGFAASASGSTVTCTNAASGYSTAPHDGGAPTGFTFTVTTEGDTAADIGFLDGNIELNVEDSFADIMGHEKGADLLGQILTGKNVSLGFTLKETSVSQLRKVIMASSGASYVPAGANATEVFGFGQSKLFSHRETKKLVLHPVALGASDKSRDLTFWKVALNFESIAYSGEEILTVPVTATVYPDTTKHARINKVVFGDGTQTLTA